MNVYLLDYYWIYQDAIIRTKNSLVHACRWYLTFHLHFGFLLNIHFGQVLIKYQLFFKGGTQYAKYKA